MLCAFNSSEQVSQAQLCVATMVPKVEMKSSLEVDKCKFLNPLAKSLIKSDVVTFKVDADIKSLPLNNCEKTGTFQCDVGTHSLNYMLFVYIQE